MVTIQILTNDIQDFWQAQPKPKPNPVGGCYQGQPKPSNYSSTLSKLGPAQPQLVFSLFVGWLKSSTRDSFIIVTAKLFKSLFLMIYPYHRGFKFYIIGSLKSKDN